MRTILDDHTRLVRGLGVGLWAFSLVSCGGGESPEDRRVSDSPDATTAVWTEAEDVEGALVDVTRLPVDLPTLAQGLDPDVMAAEIELLSRAPRHHETAPEHLDESIDYIRDELEATGLDVTELSTTYDGVELPIIYATVPGQECSDSVVVVDANYDSYFDSPGADDNASGVAAVLSLARALSDTQLPASVVLAFTPFKQPEEGGGIGIQHPPVEGQEAIAEALGVGDPPFSGAAALADALLDEGKHPVGMVSVDTIAFTKPGPDELFDPADYILMSSDLGSEPVLRTFEAASLVWLGDEGPPMQVMAIDPEMVPDVGMSEHAAFWERDIPGIMITDTAYYRNPNFHEPSDEVETLDLDFATSVTKMVLAGSVAYASIDTHSEGQADACRQVAPEIRSE